jgi:(1->4)-alpha-D-glucan 1-alpha-D-glucosylmutase
LEAGRANSLAQTLLKLTAPGVPDTYQGSELWDLHLVDPDNRAEIDYETRQSLLAEIENGLSPEEIMSRADSGLPKLWVIYKALHLRREKPDWFGANSGYVPLAVDGAKKEHLLGFLRGGRVATVVPRWNVRLGGNWGSTTVELPSGRWSNLLTGDALDGGRLRAQMLLRRFPVALLVQEAE